MTQAVIVGNARRHPFSAGIAPTQRDRKASECAQQAQGSIAIDRYSVCHRAVLVPHQSASSVSVNDKAIAALIASNRLDAAGSAIDPTDLGQQCRLGIS